MFFLKAILCLQIKERSARIPQMCGYALNDEPLNPNPMTIKEILSLASSATVTYRHLHCVDHVYTYDVFKVQISTNKLYGTTIRIHIANTFVFKGPMEVGFPILVTMLKTAAKGNSKFSKGLFYKFMELDEAYGLSF
jgi:hypothetical protein